ncbi:bZIP transcription factor 60-like [Actinidia eriantha]|uniref:bZIP transcription factor 60-like n=1 Tax=Actinidia eriantha TaxID=165200 RepID=UPI00259086B5|nr:bZIP transcription factor 60-like [Actinidia eriantha]XP_057490736.1 bZIP transcription factor 60-like [Actinidia eriantha]
MGEYGVPENEMEGKSHWEHGFDNLPGDPMNLFDPSLLSDLSNPYPDSYSLSIGDIEHLWMEDDNEDSRGEEAVVEQPQAALGWTNDFLLDSHVVSDPSDEGVHLPDGGKNSNSSPSSEEEHDGMDVLPQTENNGEGVDPVSKKRQRQLRNRDAAVRSRERKKMYVRDLEMKSRYLDGECRRLGMLLQCCCAENQALRLSLQNAKAFDASMTKQESAVLLLESLLLGSLLWLLGIVCLLILPRLLQSTVEVVLPENVDKKNQENLAIRKAKSKMFELQVFRSFMMSKRCKASRSRMKPSSLILEVLV